MRLIQYALVLSILVGLNTVIFATPPEGKSDEPSPTSKHWTADNGNGTYSNPLFNEEFEDPDIIRVGEDYYLVGTTMHMNPAVQIMHSKDLVNWELVGYCADRLDLGPAYRLEGGNIYGRGIWAPCIRYLDRMFYIFTNVNGAGLQVFRSKSIEGPWERNQLPGRHDMSILFDDDGKVYIISGGRAPYPIEELSPDLRSFVTDAPKHYLNEQMGEGHHLYKVNGKYVDISAIPGGPVDQMVAVADSLDGPWKVTRMVEGESLGVTGATPARANANDRGLWLHQGGMVDTPSGEWWSVIMSDHGSAGRMVNLVPVTWDDGFPLIGLPGNLRKAPNTWIKPDTGFKQPPRTAFTHNDDFNSGKLNIEWQWNHVPDDTKWSLTEKPGVLRLHSLPADDFYSARNSLCQRPPAPESTMTVELDTSGMLAGDTAGLALLSSPYAWIGVVKSVECSSLQMYQSPPRSRGFGPRRPEPAPTNEPVSSPAEVPEHLWLRVHCNFDTDEAIFSWSDDGRTFTPLGDPFTMIFQLTTFQGVRPALFHYNTSGKPGGYVDFDNYTVVEPRARGVEREIPIGKTITLKSGADGSYLAADLDKSALVNVAATKGVPAEANFQVVDLGLGRVALRAADGRYVSVNDDASVILKNLGNAKPGDAESFQWINLMRGDTMLMSLMIHRYLAIKPNQPGAVTVSATVPAPARKGGACFNWKKVGTGVTDTTSVIVQSPKTNPGGNPIFRDVFTADPAPLVVGDTVYVYVGHDMAKDGEMFTMPEWLCYSTKDMKNWTSHGPVLRPTDFDWGEPNSAWAAQVIQNNGKYYYFVTVKGNRTAPGNNIGVAVADSPTGPFQDAIGKPLIRDDMTPDARRPWEDIDPTVWIDVDGTPWMSWGNGDCYLVKLKPNMIELDGTIQKIELPHYVEGPWLFKRGELYYLMYAAIKPPIGSEQIAYTTADKVTGPWKFRGFVTGPAKNSFTIHPGAIEFKNQWYFFYHFAGLTINGQPGALGRRAVCVEHLDFNEDGTIKPIKQTAEGIYRTDEVPKQPVELFPLTDVRLLDSPFSNAVEINQQYLLAHDPDRLLAPFWRETGLEPKARPYGNWESGGLDGHTAGHYLSALSLMIASGDDPDGEFRRRLDYMIDQLAEIQKAKGDGYLGGIPGSKDYWKGIADGDVGLIWRKWAPWYNLHKMFAGLRDTYIHGGNKTARDLLVHYGDWCEKLTSGLSDEQMQQMLGNEHGGMNETLADIYAITGDEKYLKLAKRFNHRAVFEPLENYQDKLTGLHANTQIPKIIGMERIAALTNDDTLHTGAEFFWETVTQNRSLAFGGNSVSEHFNDPNDFSGVVEHREGPETCNTYNMLRLTEQLFKAEPKAAYADYYERALYNHILASIHPEKPGYVYFTSIRPDHYRVYSQPEQAFWCCVGTGMENPGRYGEFIYAKSKDGIYVNLFIPSELSAPERGLVLRQETTFPDEEHTRLQVQLEKPATFTLNVRHPIWVSAGGFAVKVNGQPIEVESTPSSYASIRREWKDGDTVDVELPMSTRVERLPDGSDWVAILHGPIVLAKPDGTDRLDGLFADDGRMAHVASGPMVPLDEVPVLTASIEELPTHVVPDPSAGSLHFRIKDVIEPDKPNRLPLIPFFRLHERRYQMYWELTSPEQVAARKERLAAEERARSEREAATIDSIAVGEQQPEVEHDLKGERMNTGIHNGRRWRHGAMIQYTLDPKEAKEAVLAVTYCGDDRSREFDISINGTVIATQKLTGEKPNGFIEKLYPIPSKILEAASDERLTVRFTAKQWLAGGLYDVRLLKPNAGKVLHE